MRDRLKEFALTLHPEKTRLIEFGDAVSETLWGQTLRRKHKLRHV